MLISVAYVKVHSLSKVWSKHLLEAETGSSHKYIIILKNLNCLLIYKMRGQKKRVSQTATFSEVTAQKSSGESFF